jgi:hypothetical protein
MAQFDGLPIFTEKSWPWIFGGLIVVCFFAMVGFGFGLAGLWWLVTWLAGLI